MNQSLPKLSFITPSFNQGQYIEQTILSVLSQGYPNLEYIIMDGGSTDYSVEIIKKHEENITYWHSKKDNGQAAAINEGFARATGDILCWLNSDDAYMPGIFNKIIKEFKSLRNAELVFGNCLHFNDKNKKTRGSDVVKRHQQFELSLCDYIIQPSTFFTKVAWQKAGSLNESLTFTFDWDWFIKAQKAGTVFTPIQEYFSFYRIHDAHKSGSGGDKRAAELKQIVAEYNDPRLAKAFNKWIDIYGKKNFISKAIDASQRLEISILNSIFRLLFFPKLSKKEYLKILAMNFEIILFLFFILNQLFPNLF
jgi:glycosyltransferase involved in cell wall biosynthesis